MMVKIFILNLYSGSHYLKRHMTKTRQNQRKVIRKVIETKMEGECKTRGHHDNRRTQGTFILENKMFQEERTKASEYDIRLNRILRLNYRTI